jgi:hypothetical protein
LRPGRRLGVGMWVRGLSMFRLLLILLLKVVMSWDQVRFRLFVSLFAWD